MVVDTGRMIPVPDYHGERPSREVAPSPRSGVNQICEDDLFDQEFNFPVVMLARRGDPRSFNDLTRSLVRFRQIGRRHR